MTRRKIQVQRNRTAREQQKGFRIKLTIARTNKLLQARFRKRFRQGF